MTQVSSFMGLNTALRGLLAQQRGLDVTSHNLANANTVGYSRQEAAFVAAQPLHLAAGALADGSGALLGQGVEVEAYRRLRSDFLDLQFRAQSMALGGHEATTQALGSVEAALNEPGDDGINALLNKFWNAWSDVAKYPESQPARQALVTHGESLATAIRQLDDRLDAVASDASAEYAAITGPYGPMHRGGERIQRLNRAIESAVRSGRAPNDLLDRRDVLLDELSSYGQVSVTDLGRRLVRVNFGDAPLPLVDGTAAPTWPQALVSPAAASARSSTSAPRWPATARSSTASPRRWPPRSTPSTARRPSSPPAPRAPRARSPAASPPPPSARAARASAPTTSRSRSPPCAAAAPTARTRTSSARSAPTARPRAAGCRRRGRSSTTPRPAARRSAAWPSTKRSRT
jgi:flagellar hook-associated protein FlgK